MGDSRHLERRLSRTCAPFRELLWAAWGGCLGDENVSGKFEPSAQFPDFLRSDFVVHMNIEPALSIDETHAPNDES